jgi:hypothetical protein
LVQFTYRLTTSKGDRWLAKVDCRESSKLQIEAGKLTHRRLGLPLSIKLLPVENNFSIGFYLQIRDAGGNILYILENAKGSEPNPPMLVITDGTGKIVKKLQYDREHSSVEWRPAQSLKLGDYYASIKWNMGTLGSASTKIKFKVSHLFNRNPDGFYDRAKT